MVKEIPITKEQLKEAFEREKVYKILDKRINEQLKTKVRGKGK